MLQEFCCVSEAALDVLKFELWFVIGDLDFPREQWFSLSSLCEGTDCLKATLSSGVTSLWVMAASARSVAWGRNEKLTLLYLIPYLSALMCSVQTQDSDIDSHH